MSQATTSEEYKALLLAQRSLTLALQPRKNEKGEEFWIEPRDAAMVASALTRVVDQKRVMRGQPAPKPMDVADRKRKPRKSQDYADSPVDPTAPPPAK